MKVAIAVAVFALGCGSVSALPKDAGSGGSSAGETGTDGGGGGGHSGGGASGSTGGGASGVGGRMSGTTGSGGAGGAGILPLGTSCTTAGQCASGYCSGTCSNPAFGCPPDSALRACLLFDEGSGSVVSDGSGNGNTGTSSADWVAGVSGSAADITAVSQTVVVPHSSSLDFGGQATIEAWVNPSSSVNAGTNNATIVTKFDPTASTGWALTEEAAHPNIGSDSGYFSIAGTTTLQVGTWTHLAFVADGTNITAYANGSPIALYEGGLGGTLVNPRPGTSTANQYEVEIGNWNPGNAMGAFYGAIDVVRIYARTKTAAEICVDANRTWTNGTCT